MRPLLRSLLALVVAALASAACAQQASALPLLETELNNSQLYANGPVPADGFRSIHNTSDDVDYFIVRMQGRRQVSATSIVTAGTCAGYGFTLVRADGSWERSFDATTTPDVETWTTPRDATEYIGRTRSSTSYTKVGCERVISFAPADAVIVSALPAPAFDRALDVAAPARVDPGATFSVAVTGRAADDERVVGQLTTGGCGASPPDSSSLESGPLLATGAYTQNFTFTAPTEKGPVTLCVWLADSLVKLQPLLRQQTVAVEPAFVEPPKLEPVDVARQVSLSRKSGNYRGRVTSAQTACNRNATVMLLRKGKGAKSYGTAMTRQDGSFTIRRSKVVGRLYALVVDREIDGFRCLADTSSPLRKRH